MSYKPVIGLELHVELRTQSKMFCSCKNDPNEKNPNTNICPVCTAQPGRLPVINQEAIRKVISASKIETKTVNTSVSGQSVIVRYIEMPSMTEDELTKALKLGVGKYIPFDLDSVNYDCQILGESDKNKKMMSAY